MDRSIHVLLVGSSSFVESTRPFLEGTFDHLTVEPATDATEGLDRFTELSIDCIVSAAALPDRDGIAFLESVRERDPSVPVVMIADSEPDGVENEAIAAGVTDYIQEGSDEGPLECLAERITGAARQYRADSPADSEFFELIQAIAEVGAWEYDVETEEWTFTDGTKRILGLEPAEELTITDALSFSHPADRPALLEAFERAQTRGGHFELEMRMVTETEEDGWVRIRGEPHFQGNQLTRVRGTLEDITEQKRRELALQRKNDRLEEFASVISHDLRNPLQVAMGNLDYARDTGDEAAFQQVETALDRIDTIIEDVLTLAQQGERIDQTESVNIDTIARDAWKTVDTSTITLRSIADVQIEADPDRLRQLFENLFRNAAEHSDAAVTVTVGPLETFATTTRGGSSKSSGFYVADDGPGIPADIREKVFDFGFTTTDSGTGYGLAIVAQIADAHGWDVSIDESEASGARFEFSNRS